MEGPSVLKKRGISKRQLGGGVGVINSTGGPSVVASNSFLADWLLLQVAWG